MKVWYMHSIDIVFLYLLIFIDDMAVLISKFDDFYNDLYCLEILPKDFISDLLHIANIPFCCGSVDSFYFFTRAIFLCNVNNIFLHWPFFLRQTFFFTQTIYFHVKSYTILFNVNNVFSYELYCSREFYSILNREIQLLKQQKGKRWCHLTSMQQAEK